MTSRPFLWRAAVLLLTLCAVARAEAQPASHEATLTSTTTVRYLLYLPEEYASEDDRSFPLLLFLHGGGESGDDIEAVKRHGPPRLIEEGRRFPFIVLSPLNPHERRLWDETALMALLDRVRESYRVDPRRLYLAGLSRGAYGAWRLALQYPETFAALVAVSGVAPSPYAPWLGALPTWVFHGEDDDVVPVGESDRMVEALRRVGGDVRYTRYPDTPHDAWTRAFTEPELWEWLVRQERGSKTR